VTVPPALPALPRRTTFAAVLLTVSVLAGPAWAVPSAHASASASAKATAQANAQAGRLTPAQNLGARVNAALSSSGATTVAAAVDADGLGTVVRRDAAHLLPPASTQKSFTSVAALLALPAGMRFRTEAAARVAPVNGALPGNLWLVAGGDPYLTKLGLRALARDVRAAGVTVVAGDLLLDDSRYDSRRSAAGWKPTYVPNESGPLSALAVDRNGWRRDRAYVADPAFPATLLFRDYLKAEGVTVRGATRRGIRPADAATVATRTSGPLAAVVRRILKDSDNFAAELLLKEVGKVVRRDGSSAGGHAAVVQVLRARGVAAGSGTDGSGLSAHNRQNSVGQLALLRTADQSVIAKAFRAALPVACQDGTLQKRMCNTPAAGRVFAKTGTLNGVRALSGFTTTASGRTVWFSFQLTGVKNGTQARNALDRAAVVLASAQE
jgi:D-alanyl-D-alanine carboxypeptidase/D-alanyl-D-alanine-endopeptidase (penicillin-binding protein 4)